MLSRDSGVVWITPCGRFITRFLAAAEASPCHFVTGIAASSRSPSRRSNWSFISAFSGERYSTPTLAEGFSQSRVSTGRNAASVFPLAVPLESSRFSSVSNIAFAASTCISRSSSHLQR